MRQVSSSLSCWPYFSLAVAELSQPLDCRSGLPGWAVPVSGCSLLIGTVLKDIERNVT